MLRHHYDRWMDAAESQAEGHESSFLGRAGEQCARYAANLAAWRCLEQGERIGGQYTAQDVVDAAVLIDWHFETLQNQTENAIQSEYVKAAASVADDLRVRGKAVERLLSYLGQSPPAAARKFKGDADAKRAIRDLLEECNYVTQAEGMRGWYHVNLEESV